MIGRAYKLAALAFVLAAMGLSSAASAQQVRETYISSSGSSGTGCSRLNPCDTLTEAIANISPGGTIICLDALRLYGTTINKTLTLDCPLGRLDIGTLTIDGSSGTGGGGTGIVVKLRNLNIVGYGGVTVTGINFVTGAALHVENCNIFGVGVTPAIGLKFAPTTNGAKLFVTDSIFTDNGTGSAGGGIVVQPAAGGTAQVSLNRVTVAKNTFGVAIDGTGSTGGINMTIANSNLAGNTNDGVVATTPNGGAPLGLAVFNTQTLNNGFGIRAIGNATVRVKNSEIVGNGTGLATSGAGASILTASPLSNTVEANAVNGSFTGTYSFK